MPPSTEAVLAGLIGAIDAAVPAAVELRQRLHAEPELAHAEHATARTIEACLGAPTSRFGATGLIYRIGGDDGGVVVRAELDALPLEERTTVAWRSRGPAMHACGHDVHMAALVALVEAARAAGALPAPLWAVFQPSEEAYPSGAELLVREGAVAGARACVACHVHPDVEWRTLAASAGVLNAACDNFDIRVTGRGGHAAYRHRTADPVLALADIVTSLHAVLPRRADPLHPAVVSVGELRAGTSPSIVPEHAHAAGTIRTLAPADREPLRAALHEIAERTAAAHGCGAEVTVTAGEPVLHNDERLVDAMVTLTGAAGLRGGPAFRSCGSDDFAFLGATAPLAMAYLGLSGAPGFAAQPLHHPEFLPPDEAVREVAVALAVLYSAASSIDYDSPEVP